MMEPLSLPKYIKSESQDCCLNSIPEFVTIIKQEKLTGELTDTLAGNIKLKEECILMSLDQEFGSVKTERMDSEEILNYSVTARHTEEINKNEQCFEDSSLIKIEEVHLENEDNKERSSNISDNKKEIEDDEIRLSNLKPLELPDKIMLVMYTCYKCDYKTKSQKEFESHFIGHQASLVTLHCTKCKYRTHNKDTLTDHVLCEHTPSSRESDNVIKCAVCDFKTSVKTKLSRHMKNHQKRNECSYCKYKTSSEYQLKRHVLHRHEKLKESDSHKCLMCEFKTSIVAVFKQHLFTHQSDAATVFKCSYCDYQTDCKSKINRHTYSNHSKNKADVFECYDCGLTTRIQKTFWEHVGHNRSASELKCTMCEFRTNRKCVLKKHDLTHQRAMDVCLDCNYQTKDKAEFILHMKEKHKIQC